MSKMGALEIDCPNCGRKLPPIGVKARAGMTTIRGFLGRGVEVAIEPVLDATWHRLLKEEHPECIRMLASE